MAGAGALGVATDLAGTLLLALKPGEGICLGGYRLLFIMGLIVSAAVRALPMRGRSRGGQRMAHGVYP